MTKAAVLQLLASENSEAAGEAYANAERVPDGDPRFANPLPLHAAIGYWRQQTSGGARSLCSFHSVCQLVARLFMPIPFSNTRNTDVQAM